jgi:oxygen-independent coproporphyrinogen-3 oxidase
VSVYMLEVDEDSRLGREMLGAGKRHPSEPRPLAGDPDREQGTGNKLKYGADAVPSEDEIAEWYGAACEWLEADGVRQYEISNFARIRGDGRGDYRSRHNVKYWRREPYVGFGLDAHSMLRAGVDAVRWANGDELEGYLGRPVQGARYKGDAALVQLGDAAQPEVERVDAEKGFEEAMFLGLRMNEGVDLEALRAEFGEGLMRGAVEALGDVVEAGLVVRAGSRLRLTARGRMASNEVFSRLLVGEAV